MKKKFRGMNKIFTNVVAGIIGGCTVISIQFFFGLGTGFTSETPNAYYQPVNQLTNVSPQTIVNIPSFHLAAKRSRPAVVHIAALKGTDLDINDRKTDIFDFFLNEDVFSNPFRGNNPAVGSGSGVIYSPNGYIITNKHVIERADRIEVTLYDNRKFEANIIGVDAPSDIAILKIDAIDLPVLEIGNSADAKVGEWVLAVGNPFDLSSTVTAGIISAKGRSINLFKDDSSIETFIQTDAAVNPGNSGGALVDAHGKLLGINTAIATHNGVFSGYSFAIPVDLVTRVANDIIKYGSYQRGYLGVQINELDDEKASKLGVNIAQGVVIEKIVKDGAAQVAGLQANDVIVEVNGKKIRGIPDLQEIVGTAQVGDELTITIRRKKRKLEVLVTLQSEN